MPLTRSYSASTSSTRNSVITVRLSAARAEPGPNSGTVRELAIASVNGGKTSSAKTSADQVAVAPVTCS
jgi:hypothetical protein